MSNLVALREQIANLFETQGLPRTLESDVYQWIIKKYATNRYNLYAAKCCQLLNQVKKNPDLLKKPNELLTTHFRDVSPEKWDLFEQDLKILDANIKDFDHPIYATDTFTCFKCGEKKCVYSEVQIKSCDENTTVFVRCINCNHCFNL